MPNAYDNTATASAFSDFLESDNGRIQKQLLYENILPYLLNDKTARILDAACGEGWLSARLNQDGFANVAGFDSSSPLIEQARKTHSGSENKPENKPENKIDFQIADAAGQLPYDAASHDVVILNMAAHDLDDLPASFQNMHGLLKPNGKFIMTIANPYYGFPVGVWKRGIWGRLTGKKPHLKVRPYHEFRRQGGKLFNWKGALSSYFYPMSEYINHALGAGFTLTEMKDLGMETDSDQFDVQHQLHRFPIVVLLAFEKRGE